ncbi:MAG: fumarate hydratase [Clostridia bacterium]|nr:fumarate hydratase [Clostridia bacterium]
MRELDVNVIAKAVEQMCISANKVLPEDVKNAVLSARNTEQNPLALSVLNDLEENLKCAKELDIPICQDTGMAVVFIELGQDVHLVGGALEDAVNLGVKNGYTTGNLRMSVVSDPINRVNTCYNTPAIIHTKIVPGSNVKITVAPKGFGSENMSKIFMLKPSDGEQGIIDSVLKTVISAGANPCPPIIVGVGIGGDFEQCALLSKQALIEDIDIKNPDEYYADLEKRLLELINKTGIGPQGFGGNTTALAVKIKTAPTHIAGLPVAVNIGCHVTRHITKEI